MAMPRRRPVEFLLISFLATSGCGEDDCPSTAASCSDVDCHPMRAYPLDAARSCVLAVPEVVGCTPDDVGTDDAPCVKRLSDSAGWGECTEEEREMAVFCSE